MQARLEWSDLQLLRALIVFLETQSWIQRSTGHDDTDPDDASLQEVKNAIELLSSHFRDPLEAAGANLSLLQDEIEDAVAYARTYLGIESTDYWKVWYNLFVCPNATEWPNVLLLSELAVSLPFSNARVEQIFSSLKYVKNVKRNSLNVSTLDDLIEIFVEGPPLGSFSADTAIDLWLNDSSTARRLHQTARKPYKPWEKSSDNSSGSHEVVKIEIDEDTDSEVEFTLDRWDHWFMSSEDEVDSDIEDDMF